jgi:DNA replication and repair protein RecF
VTALRNRLVVATAEYLSSSSGVSAASVSVLGRVAVERLTLTDFRSYRSIRLEMDGRPVVLTGPNGAGKTNLLEALSFLAPGRGLRGVKLNEVGYAPAMDPDGEFSGQPWAVAATLVTTDGPVDVGTGFNIAGDARRVVHINGEVVKGAGALLQHLGIVWLTPAMDRLFVDGPGSRRKFVDRLITTLDPDHAGRTTAYDHAYRQRLRLLRDGDGDESWFTALEDTLARHGIALVAARHDFMMRLNRELGSVSGPFPSAHVKFEGTVDRWLTEMPAVDAEDAMRRNLLSERRGGQDAGVGPHRSDLAVVMVAPGHASHAQPAAVCSTGEQKALLVSIMLAHARLQKERRGHVPILLLDEITAHLDPDRRTALFSEILKLGAQAWMTGTDTALFEELGDSAQFLAIRDGELVAEVPTID